MGRIRYINKDTGEEYTNIELNIQENGYPMLGIGIRNGQTFYYETAGNDSCIHAPDNTEYFRCITEVLYRQFKQEERRYNRERLLGSFDVWEKAVLRGREQDDSAIMVWYQKLLDLDEDAFENIPNKIKYFM